MLLECSGFCVRIYFLASSPTLHSSDLTFGVRLALILILNIHVHVIIIYKSTVVMHLAQNILKYIRLCSNY